MAEPDGTPGVAGRRQLRAVYEATFFVRFAFGLTIAVSAAYLAGRFSGLNLGEVGVVGLVTASAPIGEFATVLLSGIAADRYGRMPVLYTGMVGSSALFFLASFTRASGFLALIELGFGVFSGAILAPSLAVVGDRSEGAIRGHAMGRFDAMNLLGWVLGFAVGFALLGSVPNAWLPWVFRAGALALFAGWLFARYESRGIAEPPHLARVRLADLREAVLRRSVLLVTLPWMVIYMLVGAAFAFLAAAGSGIGVPPVELGAAIGGGGLLLLLTQPYFGGLADRYGRYRLMVVGTFGFLGVMGSLVGLTLYGSQPVLLAVLGGSVLAALAYGPAALAALADLSRSLTRGTTMAVYALVLNVGMILGLLLSTGLYSRLGITGIVLFFVLIAVGLALLTALRGYDLRTGRAPPELDGSAAAPLTGTAR